MMTITEFAMTPLGLSLAEKYGWNDTTWKRLCRFATDRRRAADRAGNGPGRRSRAVEKVTLELMREFGADETLCARIAQWHRGHVERMVPGGHPSQMYADLEYAASIIGDACVSAKLGGLGSALTGMTIDQAFTES